MKLGERGAIWERDNEKKGVYSDRDYSIYPFGRKANITSTPEYREGWDRIFSINKSAANLSDAEDKFNAIRRMRLERHGEDDK